MAFYNCYEKIRKIPKNGFYLSLINLNNNSSNQENCWITNNTRLSDLYLTLSVMSSHCISNEYIIIYEVDDKGGKILQGKFSGKMKFLSLKTKNNFLIETRRNSFVVFKFHSFQSKSVNQENFRIIYLSSAITLAIMLFIMFFVLFCYRRKLFLKNSEYSYKNLINEDDLVFVENPPNYNDICKE